MNKENKAGVKKGTMENCSEIILDSIADGVFTVDESFIITSFNRAAEKITGYKKEEAIGKLCSEVFNANICKDSCVLRKTIITGTQLIDVPVDIKNKDGHRIPISVSTAILQDEHGIHGGVETFRDLSVIENLKERLQHRHLDQNQVGLNSGLSHIANVLPDIAASEATVLITGQSGTGKGGIAELIHNMSARKDKPFIKVSCAALPENLLEAELFGHEKGAYTDAKTARAGRVAAAEGGTLFLDEIGEIPLPIQVKLLRFIQEKEYEPLGSSTAHKADVRILAATHRDLHERISAGEFREDLFYRLNIISFELPPLYKRKVDIPALVLHFIQKFNQRYGKRIEGASDEAMRILLAYDYPGNIRELENAIEHSFVLCKAPFIGAQHLPAQLKGEQRGAPHFIPKPIENSYQNENPSDNHGETGYNSSQFNNDSGLAPREKFEARLIRDALLKHGGNKAKAAEELNMHRSTLWRKIHRYRIED